MGNSIVVLDGYALNPGDLSWEPLRALGECRIYDRTADAEIISRSQGANILLTNKAALTSQLIARLPELKYIGVLATGFDIVDTAASRERGIPVTNVPAYGTRSVAQLVFALLLELAHHVQRHSESVRAGQWCRCPDFCYWLEPQIELAGLTMGIVGYGKIGRAVAESARAFGMQVLIYTQPECPEERNASLDALFQQSDVVSLHCPLTPQTRGLVNAQRLAQMKRSAFLINTSRGPLVDAAALAQALNDGRLAGAGLDVLASEPPPADNPLLSARNCIITPHLAWATQAARQRLLNIAVDNLKAWLAGKPENVVNF